MKASKKSFAILMVMLAVLVQPEISFSLPNSCNVNNDKNEVPANPNTRSVIRHNFPLHPLRQEYSTTNTALICDQNALCGTLDGDFDWVYGQVGIYYFNPDLQRNVFVPLYVKEAALFADSYVVPYMIPKWDGKVFWMTINPTQPPLWIQPYYLDDDPSCAGCMKFISRAMLYKQQNVDYSAYPYGAALMYMYVNANADFTVKSYTIDVYDQDDNLAQQGLQLNIGDQVQTLYVEDDDDDDDDSPDWDTVSLEDSVLITQEPEFEYAGYIPGRDFGCSNCTIDLAQADIFFRIVGYVVDPATDTIEQREYSQRVPLGKLEDNVCTNANCTYVVTPKAGVGGMVNPSTAQTVNYGTNKSFTRHSAHIYLIDF